MNSAVSEELLDVVDINDQVIDVKKRGEIHALGLMHRAVHVLVFNPQGALFLQKRSMRKDENPGQWDTSCAGHVDSGETYLNCAIRELEEELGIVVDEPLEQLFHVQPAAFNGMEHSPVYRCIYAGELNLQVEEIDEGRWLSTDEMDRLVSEPNSNFTEILIHIWHQFRLIQ